MFQYSSKWEVREDNIHKRVAVENSEAAYCPTCCDNPLKESDVENPESRVKSSQKTSTPRPIPKPI